MNLRPLIIAALAIVAGCQSDADVRSAPPLASFKSSKGPDAAVACLVPSLAKHYNAVAPQDLRFVAQIVVPNREYDVVPTAGFVNNHYIYTVNVKASGSGSTLSLYKGQMMLPSLTEAIRAGVRACV